MNRLSIARRAKALVPGILLMIGLPWLVYFFAFSHAIPVAKFNQITNGMTETQVEGVAGKPLFVKHDSPYSTRYFYGGFLRLQWCTMEIFFSSDGQVTGKFHDH